MSEKRLYETYKTLLKGTDAGQHMDDHYAFAYIDCETDLPDGGKFVSFQTGYNRDRVISFVQHGDEIRVKIGYRHNYGGYSCSCNGETITEYHNYGFGSTRSVKYDLWFNQLSEESDQSYGCCCG